MPHHLPADKSRRFAPHRAAEASACEACVHGTTASLQPAAQLARTSARLDARPGLAAGPRLGASAGGLDSVADRASQSSPVPARIPRGRQLVACLLPVTHSTGSSPSGRLLPGGSAHRWPGRCRSGRRLHCPIESDSMGHLEVLPLDTRDRDRTYVDVVGWLSRGLTSGQVRLRPQRRLEPFCRLRQAQPVGTSTPAPAVVRPDVMLRKAAPASRGVIRLTRESPGRLTGSRPWGET